MSGGSTATRCRWRNRSTASCDRCRAVSVRGAGAAQAIGGVFGRWNEIVGEAVAAHVQPIRLDGRRLVVEVSDPAWATQMRLLADRVCQRVHDVTGTEVETVEVRVAGGRRDRR